MSSTSSKRVLIAGGGIAGLATALAFQQRGWGVQVVERAVALREVGAGIQLSPNGMKVLLLWIYAGHVVHQHNH